MKKSWGILVLSVLFLTVLCSPYAQAQEAIDEAQPVTILDTYEEPIIPIPDGTKVMITEEGNFLAQEDIETLQAFTSATSTVDETDEQLQANYSMKIAPLSMVLCLPIEIIDNNNKVEKTTLFSSPLMGGVAFCNLPPPNRKFRCGKASYILRYSLSNMRLCQIPMLEYGCCSVTIKTLWRPYKKTFCYNSSCPLLCKILGLWLEGLNLGSTYWEPEGRCDYSDGICDTDTPTAAAMVSFDAQAGNGTATLSWQTGDEADIFGFNIYRSEAKDGGFIKVNAEIIRAKASAGVGAAYTFIDSGLQNRSTYYYKIEDVASDGVQTMHDDMLVSVVPKLLSR